MKKISAEVITWIMHGTLTMCHLHLVTNKYLNLMLPEIVQRVRKELFTIRIMPQWWWWQISLKFLCQRKKELVQLLTIDPQVAKEKDPLPRNKNVPAIINHLVLTEKQKFTVQAKCAHRSDLTLTKPLTVVSQLKTVKFTPLNLRSPIHSSNARDTTWIKRWLKKLNKRSQSAQSIVHSKLLLWQWALWITKQQQLWWGLIKEMTLRSTRLVSKTATIWWWKQFKELKRFYWCKREVGQRVKMELQIGMVSQSIYAMV